MPSIGDVSARLTIDTRPFSQSLRAAESSARSLGSKAGNATKGLEKNLENSSKAASGLGKSFARLGGILAATFAVSKIAGFVKSISQASAEVEGFRLSFRSLAGDIQRGDQAFEFVVSESNRIGLAVQDAAVAFRSLTAATKSTALESNTQAIFTNLAEATRKLGLGGEFARRVLAQVGQSAALGKIQTEELKVIAEAGLPAFKALANAVGVTEGEVKKLLQTGSVSSARFLLPFTEALSKLAGTENNFERFDTQLQRVKNSFFLLSASVGDYITKSEATSAILQSLTGFFNGLTLEITGTGTSTNRFVKFIVREVDELKRLLNIVKSVTSAFSKFKAADTAFTEKVQSSISSFFSKQFNDAKRFLTTGVTAEKAANNTQFINERFADSPTLGTGKIQQPRAGAAFVAPEPLLPIGLEKDLKVLDDLFRVTSQLAGGFKDGKEAASEFLSLLEAKAGIVETALKESLAGGVTAVEGRTEALTEIFNKLRLQIRAAKEETFNVKEALDKVKDTIKDAVADDLTAFNAKFKEVTAEIKRANKELEKQRKEVKESVENPAERRDRRTEEITGLGLDPETQRRALQEINSEFAKTTPIVQTLQTVLDGVGSTFKSSLEGIAQGTQTVGQAFKNLGQSILASLANAAIQAALSKIGGLLSGSIGGGAGGGIASGIAGNLFKTAATGMVTNGEQTVTVGDNPGGREFIVPSQFLTPESQQFLEQTLRARRPLKQPSFATGGIIGTGGGGRIGGEEPALNLIFVDDRNVGAQREQQLKTIDQRVMQVVLSDINKGRGSAVKRRFEKAGR